MDTLLKKMGYKDQVPFVVLNAPEGFLAALQTVVPEATDQMPDDEKAIGMALVFCIHQEEVDMAAARLAARMPEDQQLWFAYPKGTSKRYKCTFNRDTGWAALGALGYEGVRMIAIDEDWSGLRFRRVGFIKTMTRSFAMTDEGKKKTIK
jgi:hypothetical protein